MTTRQQQQALSFFDSFAEQWRQRAEGQQDEVNVIAQRNDAAIRAAERLDARRILDLGCGTGELVIDLARQGREAVGVDFAPQMVELAKQKAAALAATTARFVVGSALDYDDNPGSFDVISAMGFIEYISSVELDAVIARSARLASPRGHLVIGSRNRLFNAVSLSAYTQLELQLASIERLLREAIAFAMAETLDEAIAAGRGESLALPTAEEHPQTGIGVKARHQYTPWELARRLAKAGFGTVVGVYPIHYHPMPVPAMQALNDPHVAFSTSIYSAAPTDHRLVPYASSFIIEVRRSG